MDTNEAGRGVGILGERVCILNRVDLKSSYP